MNKTNVLVEITAWLKMCSEDESLNFLMQSHNTLNKENTNPLRDQNTERRHLNLSGEWISIQSFLKIKKEMIYPAKCLANIRKCQFKLKKKKELYSN